MEFTDIFPVDKLYIYLIILLISALIYWKVPKDIALPVVLICLFSFASIYFFFGREVNQNIQALGFDHRDSKGRSAGFVSALMMLGLLLSLIVLMIPHDKSILSWPKRIILSILSFVFFVVMIFLIISMSVDSP